MALLDRQRPTHQLADLRVAGLLTQRPEHVPVPNTPPHREPPACCAAAPSRSCWRRSAVTDSGPNGKSVSVRLALRFGAATEGRTLRLQLAAGGADGQR